MASKTSLNTIPSTQCPDCHLWPHSIVSHDPLTHVPGTISVVHSWARTLASCRDSLQKPCLPHDVHFHLLAHSSVNRFPPYQASLGIPTHSAFRELSQRCLSSLECKWGNAIQAPTVCEWPRGMHFSPLTSSELIGGNAEQYWLREGVRVDPTWAENMCMGPICCFHHLPPWEGATSGSHYHYERYRLHACSKAQLWFHNQLGEAGGK